MNRQIWLSALATAPHADLIARAAPFDAPAETLRPPEIGSVMVRGRAGGTGASFNLGEMTVTRCSVRVGDHDGHGWVQGRSKPAARAAAMVDALMQSERAGEVQAAVIDPLAEAAKARRTTRAQKAEATKVDFFTLVRGED